MLILKRRKSLRFFFFLQKLKKILFLQDNPAEAETSEKDKQLAFQIRKSLFTEEFQSVVGNVNFILVENQLNVMNDPKV